MATGADARAFPGLQSTKREFDPIAGERRNAALSIAAMPDLPMALTGVPTEELKQLLRRVHRNEIAIPITPANLAFVGLQHRAGEIMQSLRGLDEPGARAVLVAVLAERRQAEADARG
ncbi:hypothetical protein ACNOYE_23460 [Nannocystaceae bacterium ST9]